MHTCAPHMHTHTYMHQHTHILTHAYILTHAHTYTHAHTCTHICTCTHIHTCNIRTSAHTRAHIHKCTHTRQTLGRGGCSTLLSRRHLPPQLRHPGTRHRTGCTQRLFRPETMRRSVQCRLLHSRCHRVAMPTPECLGIGVSLH